jgi:Predicted nucleic acid-binding protein, contains PIN domain
MKFMLDTNICIYLIRKNPVRVLKKLQEIKASEVCISSITLAELEYGVQKSQNQNQNRIALTEFIAPLEIEPFEEDAAIKFGEIRTGLEKKGSVIGAYDMLIAAHALSLNVTLVTNNLREFLRIPSLRVENWV